MIMKHQERHQIIMTSIIFLDDQKLNFFISIDILHFKNINGSSEKR